MHRRKKNLLKPQKKGISWSEIIILSFLTCIAMFLLYSSLNRPTEDIVIKDMKVIDSAIDLEGNEKGTMN